MKLRRQFGIGIDVEPQPEAREELGQRCAHVRRTNQAGAFARDARRILRRDRPQMQGDVGIRGQRAVLEPAALRAVIETGPGSVIETPPPEWFRFGSKIWATWRSSEFAKRDCRASFQADF